MFGEPVQQNLFGNVIVSKGRREGGKKGMKRLHLSILTLVTTLLLLFPQSIAAQDDSAAQCTQGVKLFTDGQAAEALPLLEAGFAKRDLANFANPDNLGICAMALGLLRSSASNYSGALETYQVAWDIFQTSGNRGFEGITLNNIGEVYRAQGRYSEALDSYQQARIILSEVGIRYGEGTALNGIGSVYMSQGRYAEALDSFQQALAIHREVGIRSGEGTALNGIGSVYMSQGRYAEALDSFQQALAIHREVGDRAEEGTAFHNIGAVYQAQGRYSEALDYFQQALTIRREVGDRAGEGDTLDNIGGGYQAQGRYSEALDYFQQALTIRREVGDRAGEGASLNNIGSVYQFQGQYGKALDSYQQARIILSEVGSQAGESTILNNMGSVYVSQGRFAEALNNSQQALAISREMGDRPGEGATLNNIGVIYQAQGRYSEALDYFQQALTIVREVGNRIGEGAILNGIGGIYQILRRYGEALDYYQQALVISREVGGRAVEGTILSNIGAVYIYQGRYGEALDSSLRAVAISRGIGDRIGEGSTFHNLGGIYRAQGQYDEALDSFRQAIIIFDSIRVVAGSEVGRAEFIALHTSTYRAAVDILQQQGQAEAAFLTVEQSRGRAFLDSLSTGQVQLADTTITNLLTQEQARYTQRQVLQDDLTKAKAVNPSEPELIADLENQLAEIEADYIETQRDIAAQGAELASLVPGRSADYILEAEQAQKLLDHKTTLISYYVLEDKILAFLLTEGDFQIIPLEVNPEQLTKQIIAFRDFNNVDISYPESAMTLYQWLIEPLKSHLKASHLAIIPHSVLHFLPFAALTDGKRYLIDDYTLTTLPSASSLPFIQKNAKQTAYTGQPVPLVLGNPVTGDYDTTASLAVDQRQYRDQLGSLPYAEKEAKAIADLFRVKPLIGQAATESAVREQVSQANILHLAAHGTFNPIAPLNSLIALAPDPVNNSQSTIDNSQFHDGWLTVGEIYGLDLKKTDLVVLSACETNLGDLNEGDELVGLTRAFIFAGTPSVIASLWNVEDEATSLLMERFYTHLKDGLGKAEALRQAQLDMRQEYPNPYYWAGFVLSGDGGVSPTTQALAESSQHESTSDILSTSWVNLKASPASKWAVVIISALVIFGSLRWYFSRNQNQVYQRPQPSPRAVRRQRYLLARLQTRCLRCGYASIAGTGYCQKCNACLCVRCCFPIEVDESICRNCGEKLIIVCTNPKCEREVAFNAARCPYCRVDLRPKCPSCGGAIDFDNGLCLRCEQAICPKCYYAVGDNDSHCNHCGTEFVFACPTCTTEVSHDVRVCPKCRTYLD
ncbi:MAG: tetratricopeptide repeat protein [Anaerolineae bacterium]|nr:tetratricopeptide repeat protein [Anaerolineae bacterium]